MPDFVSYIKNDQYAVGCTGQTTYVYDIAGNELAKFRKDMLYAYYPAFCPHKNIFIVKSNEGRLGVYSLDSMSLIKKVRFYPVNKATTEQGYCFSPDGEWFFNIEPGEDGLKTSLGIYDTETFTRQRVLFWEDKRMVLEEIEYDPRKEKYYVLGYMRDPETGVASVFFVAEFTGDSLGEKAVISIDTNWFLWSIKRLEREGFTEKAKSYSSFARDKDNAIDLNTIQNRKIYLSDYM